MSSYQMDPALMRPRRRDIDLVVIHYTALGADMSRAMLTQWAPWLDCLECGVTGRIEGRRCGLCLGRGRYPLGKKGKRSAHYLITKEGVVEQLAPLDQATFHSGGSIWRGEYGVNDRSIGIELENYGPLQKRGSHLRTWVGQTIYAEDKPFKAADGSWWDSYPERQMKACRELLSGLSGQISGLSLVGHEEINPRKRDPGPGFVA